MKKLFYLTLAALILIGPVAKADDLAWGSTTGGTIVKIDATTGQLLSLSYNGVAYTSFNVMDSSRNRIGSSLILAQNANGILYAIDNSALYSINTTLAPDRNNTPSFAATQIISIGGGNQILGLVSISSNLLDISLGNYLYQYNLSTQSATYLGTFSNNATISGLAYNGSLYGVQYSSSPGAIELVSNVNLSGLKNSSFQSASQQSCLFAGASLLYLFDGLHVLYSYNFGTNALTVIPDNLPEGIRSMTPITVAGGGTATPTPSPTPTPTPNQTPTPTPTPTPTATPKITYSVPTSGALQVTAPESVLVPGTTASQLRCAPGYTYTASPTASFASGATIDPNGTLAIYRYYETTSDGTYPATPVPIAAVPASVVWAWTSGTTNSHAAISYLSAQDGNTTPFSYGRETLKLVYTSPGAGGTQTTLDTKAIYLYPWNTSHSPAPTAAYYNAVSKAQLLVNPSPYLTPSPSFHSDPPRVTVQMNNLYPSGTSSVIIYPGDPTPNPTGYTTIANTSVVTPSAGLLAIAPAVTFELKQSINTSLTTAQTYTIAAIQTLPPGYPSGGLNPVTLNAVTFSITVGFNLDGTVGTVK